MEELSGTWVLSRLLRKHTIRCLKEGRAGVSLTV